MEWDAEMTDSQASRFISWLNELPVLNQIEIPRRLGKGNLTLHTFCDASGSAYAAAVFARTENENEITVTLLSARSRIAPEKATILRLKLMAASIAATYSHSDRIFNARSVIQRFGPIPLPLLLGLNAIRNGVRLFELE